MVVKSEMDLIKTIEDDDEVENLSEDSDVEIEVREDEFSGNSSNLQWNFPMFSVSTNEAKETEERTL
jgi:hypothetical protein